MDVLPAAANQRPEGHQFGGQQDPVRKVLAALGAFREVGRDHWIAKCPAHLDRHPSLDVSRGTDGRALLHCWGDCPTAVVLEKVGLTFRDLFVQSRSRVEVARWAIRNPTGDIVAWLARLEPGWGGRKKDYIWYQPDGRRKGLRGLPLTQLPLYGSEIHGADPIVLTEGPKAADAVREAGFLGLGTVTGAAVTPGAPALAALESHSVVLWPDFDTMGVTHMSRIGQAIIATASDVSVVVPDASWAPGVDAADVPVPERRLLIGRAQRISPMRSQEGKCLLGPAWQLGDEASSPNVFAPRAHQGLIRDNAPGFAFASPSRAEFRELTDAYAILQGKPVSRGQEGLLRGCYRVHGPDALALMQELFADRRSVYNLLLDLRHVYPRCTESRAAA